MNANQRVNGIGSRLEASGRHLAVGGRNILTIVHV